MATTFLETPRFPDDIARGSAGGPRFAIESGENASGTIKANSRWDTFKVDFDVATGIKKQSQMYALFVFFIALKSSTVPFRFKYWDDYKSGSPVDPVTPLDQSLGLGDGVTTDFQLVKTYVVGTCSTAKTIKKPVSGTVRVAIDTVEQATPGDFTVDYTTGIVTFSTAPAVSAALTWGGEFDFPVRFTSPSLDVSWDAFQAQRASIPVTEDFLE